MLPKKCNPLGIGEICLSCPHYGQSERPCIELFDCAEGETLNHVTEEVAILFVKKGLIEISSDRLVDLSIREGMFFLFSPEDRLSIHFLEAGSIFFCYLSGKMQLCKDLKPKGNEKTFPLTEKQEVVLLETNDSVSLFFDAFIKPVRDGFFCVFYMRNKINELLILIQAYYPKELLSRFFSPLFSGDAAFKAHILNSTNKVFTVNEMAAQNYSSLSTFRQRFKKVLGTTPLQWKNEERKKLIWRELKTTDKTLKQISEDCGFQSATYFTVYCKKHFGKTPGAIRK